MRDYYERDGYKVLQSTQTFDELEMLAKFWDDVAMRNEKFSARVLRRLYVLNWAPYNIWAYVVSIYVMGNRNIDEEKFFRFLNKITAMLLMYAITNPGVQAIRRPFFVEFQNILHGRSLEFRLFKQQEKLLRERLNQTNFSNQRAITGAMLAWWTFRDEAQELPPINTKLEIEHIYAKNRCNFAPLQNPDALEFIGNKSLLEKRINIGAADYRFTDKKKFYLGWQPPGKGKKYQQCTFNLELQELAKTQNDFTEQDILERNYKIFDAFIEYLRKQDLLI